MAQIRFQGASTVELVRRLINNVSTLADKEVELARQEVKEEAKSAVGGVAVLAVGAVLLLVAFVSLVMALVLFLAQFMPGWLAAILVAIAFGIIGAAVAFVGKQRLEIKPLEKTRETLQEDFSWAQRRTKPSEK